MTANVAPIPPLPNLSYSNGIPSKLTPIFEPPSLDPLVFRLHKEPLVVVRMRMIITFIALVGASLPAWAEYGQHAGGTSSSGARSLTAPTSKALTDALNACQVGRSTTATQPKQSIQPQPKPIYSLTPPEPKKESGPFARENPRENPEFPGEEKFKECLKAIPAIDFVKCPQTLTTCHAETVDGGKTKIRPLSLDGGNPCTAGTDIYEMACGRGLEFDRFKNDIKCEATSFPLADIK